MTILAGMIAFSACSAPDPGPAGTGDGMSQAARQTGIADGFYALIDQGPTPKSLAEIAVPHRVLVYDGRFTESPQLESPEYVAVAISSFVPLVIEGTPGTTKDDRGYTLLSVTVAQAQQENLGEFTRVNLGKRVALVLDGEVVTRHKVRSVIRDGQLQITRCADDACSVLYSKLTE